VGALQKWFFRGAAKLNRTRGQNDGMETHSSAETSENEVTPIAARLDTKKLASILGKEARYMFELPKGCPKDDFEAAFADQFPRSQHFAGFLNEDLFALEFDLDGRGCLRLGVYLSERLAADLDEARRTATAQDLAEELEDFVNDFRGVAAELRTDPGQLDDGLCLAGCGFYRQESTGFCSVHAPLAPRRAEYAAQHSEKVREDICEAVTRYQAFASEPLPAEFSEEFSGDGWGAVVTFRIAGYR
jgi:hypothetical protein